MPILCDTDRHVTAYDKGDELFGSINGSIHFTDYHPLVQWIEAMLEEDGDIIEELHTGGATPQADYRYRDGHQVGLAWVAGVQLPGPRVENTVISRTQQLDGARIDDMLAIEHSSQRLDLKNPRPGSWP